MVTALVALLFASTPAVKQRTKLSWDVAADCPPREAFVAALQFRTTRAEIVDDLDETKARIAVRIERVGRQYRGALVLDLPTGVTRRQASSPRCSSIVEALSLMSALVIDPEHAKTGPLPPQLPAPVASVTPLEQPPISPPEERHDVAPPPVPPPPVEPATVSSAAPSPPAASNPSLGAALHLTTAISGLVDMGGSAQLSYERTRFVARLELGGGSGRVVTSAQGEGQYPFHLLGSLSAGLTFSASLVQFELLATLQGLVFSVSAPRATQPVEALRLSPSIGPSAGVLLRLGRWTVGLRAFTGFNLRLDTYVIDPDGGVFSNPLVFVQPSLVGSFAL